MKFAAKLTIIISGIVLAFAAVLFFVVYTSNMETLEKEIKVRLQEAALHVMDKIDRMLFEGFTDIKIIAGDPIISSKDSTPEEIRKRLVEYRNQHKTYLSLSFFDLNRTRIADTSGLGIGTQSPLITFWKNPGIGKGFVMDVSESPLYKKIVIHFAYPVKDKNGETIGVVVARIPISKLHYATEVAPEIYGEREEVEIDLVDKDGLLLYSNHNRKGILKEIVAHWESIKKSLKKERVGTARCYHEGEGEKIYVFVHEQGYLDFKGNDWTLLMHIPTKVAFASAVKLRDTMAVVLAVTLVFSMLITLFFSRSISRPIAKFHEAAQRIGSGNLDCRIDLDRKDELGILANTFNKMVSDLKKVTASRDDLNKEMAERKRAEEALKKSHDELEQALSELKRTQAHLIQSEKMASIGQLAAGVAHEINNPTGFVSSNLKTLSDYQNGIFSLIKEYSKLIADLKEAMATAEYPGSIPEQMERIVALESEVDINYIMDDIPNLIKESREGTERIKKIVIDLKDFAHPGDQELKCTDLNHNLESTLNIVWNELKYKATVTKDYGDLPEVQCYPQQINQVFMNLLVNAAQAIEKHGEIRIITRALDGQVEIAISDTGAGIPEENLSKIFDPFFTTKDVGKGTGLGLNIAYNNIKNHKGTIDVESKVGTGTTFIIRIPVGRDA